MVTGILGGGTTQRMDFWCSFQVQPLESHIPATEVISEPLKVELAFEAWWDQNKRDAKQEDRNKTKKHPKNNT